MSASRNARRLARKDDPPAAHRSLLRNRAAQLTKFGAKQRALAEWYVPVLMASGEPPHDRAVAAAHEAGHAVVAATLGGKPELLTVFEDHRGRWGGQTDVEWPPEIRMRFVNPLTHPWETTHAILFRISGFVGEEVAGVAHPASSPDEVFEMVQTCVSVAHWLGLDSEALIDRVMADAAKRITANRSLFEAMRRALEVTDTLTAEQAADLVQEHGLLSMPLRAAWTASCPVTTPRSARKAVKQ